MSPLEIPFVKLVQIKQDESNLSLDCTSEIQNHINTIHAAAQFALAETQSGLHLQEVFPKLQDKVIPILRDAKIKYKQPATQKILAFPKIEQEDIEKFNSQFEKKGRALIDVNVEVKDIENKTTAHGTFTWYIQAI